MAVLLQGIQPESRVKVPPASESITQPLRHALEQFPQAAAVVDGEGVVLAANAHWRAAHPVMASGDGNGPRPAATESGRDLRAQRMETVGRLTGGVAHDFANLLTLIAGYADILLNRIGQRDPLRPELEEIRKAASRGARLTGQLLGFTRGKAAELKPLDLNALVTEMRFMLRLMVGEYVEVDTMLATGLWKVMADAGQMEQVIMNLILNARDAMPSGGRLRIETCNTYVEEDAARTRGIQPGAYVVMEISDTGHGIAPDAVGLVFQPFFTTKKEGEGTGLGLSTVLSIVTQSGGDIRVRSVAGEGASFTLCLPRAEHTSAPEHAAIEPSRDGTGSETVLLVEDEDDVRRLLAHVLAQRGYKVLGACDGEEALHLVEKHGLEIRLVLTDMVMPRMSGRELGEHLARLRPDLKIIYMSGYTDDVLVRTGALGPGMTFLQKPLRSDELTSKVREALDSASRPFDPR
jgi:two-component system, cell cycle sensor histidine kinase and response regulator CckA